MADFIKDTLANIPGVDPRIGQRSSTFSDMNQGPAAHVARLAGLVQEKDQVDDSPYYTSNFGQVMPASGHPLNVGGFPTQMDPFLLEKQQAFDRSKIQERIVHPCGSSAFGSFKVTHDISHLTKADFLQPGKNMPVYHATGGLNSSLSKRRAPTFDPSVAEAPFQAASNVVSRMGYWKHEGQPSEYDQVRELYTRVMTEQQRQNLHSNTAKLLRFADALVQKNYLIQITAVHPNYGKSIYDLLPSHEGYTFEEISEGSKTAHLVGKDPEMIFPDKEQQYSQFMGMPYTKTKA